MNNLTKIIEQNQAYLENYAIKLLGCPQKAKDLYQETLIRFIRAYRKGLFTHKSEGDTKSYLGCVMHNQFVNDYQKNKRRKNIGYNITDPNLFLEYHPSAENGVWQVFEREDIEKAMMRLPDRYQASLWMFGEGHSYDEIANELNLTIGTVKSRIHRARKKLLV